MSSDPAIVLDFFKEHYAARLGSVDYQSLDLPEITNAYCLHSPLLKPGNGPRLLLQPETSNCVVVLTHGLSDCPFYVQAIANHFYRAGCHVVMPLLPAHGLVDPDEAMQDEQLDRKWRETIDHAVHTAGLLGNVISIGGFSTGGALSLNRILRDRSHINGGLFLFSAALSIGGLAEVAGRISFIQSITRITDGKLSGIGRDPYKYPVLPSFAGFELVQIINENKTLLEDKQLELPVFAAHSVHDATAELAGIISFMENYVEKGVTILVSAQVPHASLPLEKAVELNLQESLGPKLPPSANPMFDWMMAGAMRFYREEVRNEV
ncbi:alpha/beta hydrolase [Flavilitoribacter nigricans]|uniref:Uncharacterized protein n=1 Tax=Flavilitoribacter nigricans (strain ATCC 23147 / DSM 23189 / NBRC 102662 / NCIMB 1420 / SS-2) TaxID=1122177 RepID=A0A2D0MWI5_FLAN2|nr:hypothetical protein [Flavilitoribacter nigricans]PHN00624.1 hypothetical protein CRP01_41270 [Flavilitoribacter nigricans DSM 23189 = NBRC 102662]